MDTLNITTADSLEDVCMQRVLDSLIEQCCDNADTRSKEDLNEMFDQIQYYIESEGMSVNAGHSQTGVTPLIAACKCNMPEFVQFLILRQANVYIRDKYGFEAINYARHHADGFCLQILMGCTNYVERLSNKKKLANRKEKSCILAAYQQQFKDDNEVDHDLILSLLEGLYRNGHSGAIMVFCPAIMIL
ncbi:Probable ATP-dependent RNA helicase YTHDC2 [Eumeta japonica]|uniref:Probable ATP-dependent RNA helicase YTHDC2 n=1 Tax=Eumeta variegata TaxID=151549 RepID=A0A4C1T052_EUMVA|nr:Probable ATP-dependent RNA helicase YTHDC2 [Eumeta japonica]